MRMGHAERRRQAAAIAVGEAQRRTQRERWAAQRGLVIVCHASTLRAPRRLASPDAHGQAADGAECWMRLLEDARERRLIVNEAALRDRSGSS